MKIYVTKWVTARGILVLDGTKPIRRGRSRNWYTTAHGVGNRLAVLKIGSEAFLTLKEARVNARVRFAERYERARTELRWASQAWTTLQAGVPVQVHTKPKVISGCHPFTAART